MLKVSFKDDFKKIQVFNNKATVVNLTGTVNISNELYTIIPYNIAGWAFHHPSVEVIDSLVKGWTLKTTGTSVCAEEDSFNSVIGERIAEARAKLKIYKFMCALCSKLLYHYYTILYGNDEISKITESHSQPPKDCIYRTYKKYRNLVTKEIQHLDKLLEKA